MEAIFLGTGAAQGVPPAFARNEFFSYIRKTKGRELRSKASLRVGRECQFDIGPDTNWQNIRFDLDMYDLKHLFVTHTHSDHFSYFELFDMYQMSYEIHSDCPEHNLNLYMSRPALDWVYKKLAPVVEIDLLESKIKPVPLDYYKTYKCENFTFDTVKGFHKAHGEGEYSINYLVNYGTGSSILYATDTGYYSDETFEYLKGRKADVVVMECTFGDNSSRGELGDGHLNLETFNMQIERMAKIGFIDNKTPIYITHLSPTVEHKHEDFQKILDQYDFSYILSFDGLKFKFGEN